VAFKAILYYNRSDVILIITTQVNYNNYTFANSNGVSLVTTFKKLNINADM